MSIRLLAPFLFLSLLASAAAQSGCYNADGAHACNCDTAEADCTGTWTAGCACANRVDPPPPPKPPCSTDTTYHLHGGYYIEGVSGVDNDDRSLPDGRRADKTAWTNDTYYPHGEMKLCTGMYCSEAARTVGESQYVYAHTCAKIRFTYAADSGSTVYEMASKEHFDNCSFTDATLKCAADAGAPCDVHIEANDEHKVYYYASEATCEFGQQVAISVSDHFSSNYAQCMGMGAGSSRIQHCDCDHSLRATTLIEPCFSGFVAGCKADMPDDTSCCPGDDASYSMGYVNGGQCIPKSDLEGFMDVAVQVYDMMTCNRTKVDEFDAMEECPKVSMWGSAREPVCTMVKKVLRCDVASPAAECARERNFKLYLEHTNTLDKPVCAEGSPEPPATTDITATFTLAGSVSSLTDTDKLNIKKAVAKGAAVKLSAVTMAYADGSIVATATIAVADEAEASAASTSLNEGIMASTAALTTALATEGVTATVEEVVAAVVHSPPPPPADPPPPPTAPPPAGMSGGVLVAIIAAIVVLLGLAGVAGYMMMKKKAPTKLASAA